MQEIDGGNDSNIILPTPEKSKSVFNEKKAAREYIKSFSTPKVVKPVSKHVEIKTKIERPQVPSFKSVLEKSNKNEAIESLKQTNAETVLDEHEPVLKNEITVQNNEDNRITTECEGRNKLHTVDNNCVESDLLDDDFDMTIVEDYAEPESKKEEITEEQLLSGWNTMLEGTNNEVIDTESSIDSSHLPMIVNEDGDKVFRFFWWDAVEDRKSQPGVVFLFGKVFHESLKSYVSCCVAVRNINRKIYVLPRSYFKSNPSKEVTLLNVYEDFNNNIATKLHLDEFKSKKVVKNYAFHPSVPTQSEYLEVRYSAKLPPLNNEHCSGETYSRIFGVNSSYLEILLLECKIKGPCWLDVIQPEVVTNSISWCKLEVNCLKVSNLSVVKMAKQTLPPPPLVVAAINMRTVVGNDKKCGVKNEIVMLSCLVQTNYLVHKPTPHPPFQQHFCGEL